MKENLTLLILFYSFSTAAQDISKLISDSVFRYPIESGKILYKMSDEIQNGQCYYEWTHFGWKDKKFRYVSFNQYGIIMSDSVMEERNLSIQKKTDLKYGKESFQDLQTEIDLYRYKVLKDAREIWMSQKAKKTGNREILEKNVTIWTFSSGSILEIGEWNGIPLYEKRKIGKLTFTMEAINLIIEGAEN